MSVKFIYNLNFVNNLDWNKKNHLVDNQKRNEIGTVWLNKIKINKKFNFHELSFQITTMHFLHTVKVVYSKIWQCVSAPLYKKICINVLNGHFFFLKCKWANFLYWIFFLDMNNVAYIMFACQKNDQEGEEKNNVKMVSQLTREE